MKKKEKKNEEVYITPDKDFIRHLEETSKRVSKWPDWKRNWLGSACPKWKKSK